jgi:hypothetical protein
MNSIENGPKQPLILDTLYRKWNDKKLVLQRDDFLELDSLYKLGQEDVAKSGSVSKETYDRITSALNKVHEKYGE